MEYTMNSKSASAASATHDLTENPLLLPLACALLMVAVLWAFFPALPPAQAVGVGSALILFLAFKGAVNGWEAKVDTKFAKGNRTTRGAMREPTMGEILDQLGDEYLAIYDVRCQFGNIDHIVLSKGHGAFLIERETSDGRGTAADLAIPGTAKPTEKDFVAPTLKRSEWLVQELQTITGVSAGAASLIVFANAAAVDNQRSSGITFTNMKFLLNSIRRLGKPLPSEIWAARETIAGRLN